MRRTLVLVLALILVIGMASFARAGDTNQSPSQANAQQLQISDAQKAKLTSLMTQMLELKKEILKDNLKNGVITQDQYSAMEKRINARLETLKSGKFTPGLRPDIHEGMGPNKDRYPKNGAGWQQPQTQS